MICTRFTAACSKNPGNCGLEATWASRTAELAFVLEITAANSRSGLAVAKMKYLNILIT